MDALEDGLREIGGQYTLRFGFEEEDQDRTSHYIVFVTKDALGHKIMKEIMAKESGEHDEGVPTFELARALPRQGLLFGRVSPMADLRNELIERFHGRTLTVETIYKEHNVGTRYILRNYQDALLRMESEGFVIVDTPAAERPKRKGVPTLARSRVITFPRRLIAGGETARNPRARPRG